MQKEHFELLKKEAMYLGVTLVATLIAFKIAFYKEGFLVTARMVFSLYWLFILPGHALLFYYREKLRFAERFVISFLISAGILGIFSYYFALLGFNLALQTYILPVVLVIIGISINKKFFH